MYNPFDEIEKAEGVEVFCEVVPPFDGYRFLVKYKGHEKKGTIPLKDLFGSDNTKQYCASIIDGIVKEMQFKIDAEEKADIEIWVDDEKDLVFIRIINESFCYDILFDRKLFKEFNEDRSLAYLNTILPAKLAEKTNKNLNAAFGKKKTTGSNDFSMAAKNLPGVDEIVKECPGCKENGLGESGYDNTRLYNLIMHLNDSHKWSREKIADWIESYFDEVPAFQVKKEEENVEDLVFEASRFFKTTALL